MRYARPQTLPDALALLAGGQARVLAGGTDLYPATQDRQLAGDVVDLTAIPQLGGVSEGPEGLRIGAATTWSSIAEATLPPALAALQQAARLVGGRQIQNAGTLGGNLCNASPAADGVPPLLAASAEVELFGRQGARRLPLAEFLLGPRHTALGAGEILVAVHVPRGVLSSPSCFVKLGARAHLVISIAMVAARLRLEGGRIAEAALAVGSCGPVATRLPELEAQMAGQSIEGAQALVTEAALAAHLRPIDDIRASGAYRLTAAAELLRRAIAGCAP